MKEFHTGNAASERPALALRAPAPLALSHAEAPIPLVHRSHRARTDEGIDLDLADCAVPLERWARRPAWIRGAGWVLVAGLYAALVMIASTPAGGDAIAAWLTMGHAQEVRQVVQHR